MPLLPAIHCPHCRYNLIGLDIPRCPECGSEYTWAQLTEQHLHHLPWLIESAPGLRPYGLTHLALLQPNRFWRKVHPVLPIHFPRLLRFSALSCLLTALILALLVSAPILADAHSRGQRQRQILLAPTPRRIIAGNVFTNDAARYAFLRNIPLSAYLDANAPILTSPGFLKSAFAPAKSSGLLTEYARRGSFPFLLLPLTILTLLIFRPRNPWPHLARSHLLRIAFYSADPAAFAGLLLFSATLCFLLILSDTPPPLDPLTLLTILTFLHAVFVLYRLDQASHLYLQLPRTPILILKLLTAFTTAAILLYL